MRKTSKSQKTPKEIKYMKRNQKNIFLGNIGMAWPLKPSDLKETNNKVLHTIKIVSFNDIKIDGPIYKI